MYTLTQWIMRTASLDYCGDQDILQMHQELHNDFGEAPTEGIVGCEQAIVTEMQKRSFEHRHFDALSKAAGTLRQISTRWVPICGARFVCKMVWSPL